MSIADIARADTIVGLVSSIFGTPPPGGPGNLISSNMILSARGTFYWVSISDDSSPGMYAIEELSRFIGQQQFGNAVGPVDPTATSAVPPVLLTSVEFNQTDITSEMPCLNNVKVFYTFGQNFGQAQITGEVLLGPLGNDQQHNRGFRLIRDFFFTYRVSRRKLPVAVSIANEVYFVYLKGLRIGQIDPNYHIMPFILFGTLLDISREDAASVNPSSTVITSGTVNTSKLISALQATAPSDLTISDNAVPSTSTATPGGASTPATGKNPGQSNSGSVASPAAAILNARTNGEPLTDDMKAWQKTNQTIFQMQAEHNSLQEPLSTNSQTYYEDQINQLQLAQSSLGDRIVQHSNNPGAQLTDIPDTDTQTLNDYGLNPVTAQYNPQNFDTHTNNFAGSLGQRVAQGTNTPTNTPPGPDPRSELGGLGSSGTRRGSL